MQLKSIVPSILLSIGFVLIALANSLPLFEWHIGESTSDFPPAYDVHIAASPWKAQLGDSLDHGLYISFGKVYVSVDEEVCRYEDWTLFVKRSSVDKKSEQAALIINEVVFWIIERNWIGILLCLGYIWWFTIEHRRPVWEGFVFTVVAVLIYYEATQIARILLPNVVPFQPTGTLDCYQGTVTLYANLSKVHLETSAILLLGIGAELIAIGLILGQITGTHFSRRQPSNG